ncbi:hypothetical protein Ahy_A07g036373 isoform B [Arachis hypogaea]|uniref:Uncharacterized protein n=1 Tax=Arachis hypogaea TaxID=3818 RepID=A0A445CG00_ARAHY|nr:hypothetical protein Ahy_A07g036373 isoform B [Arachis hypogaea]
MVRFTGRNRPDKNRERTVEPPLLNQKAVKRKKPLIGSNNPSLHQRRSSFVVVVVVFVEQLHRGSYRLCLTAVVFVYPLLAEELCVC